MSDEKPKRGKGPLTPYECAEKTAGLRADFRQDMIDAGVKLEEKLRKDEAELLERVPQDERELARELIGVTAKRDHVFNPTLYPLGEDINPGGNDWFHAGVLFELRDGKLYLADADERSPEREDGA